MFPRVKDGVISVDRMLPPPDLLGKGKTDLVGYSSRCESGGCGDKRGKNKCGSGCSGRQIVVDKPKSKRKSKTKQHIESFLGTDAEKHTPEQSAIHPPVPSCSYATKTPPLSAHHQQLLDSARQHAEAQSFKPISSLRHKPSVSTWFDGTCFSF